MEEPLPSVHRALGSSFSNIKNKCNKKFKNNINYLFFIKGVTCKYTFYQPKELHSYYKLCFTHKKFLIFLFLYLLSTSYDSFAPLYFNTLVYMPNPWLSQDSCIFEVPVDHGWGDIFTLLNLV